MSVAPDLHLLPSKCRHRFPIFEKRVYVNSCSQGALSDAVRSSYEQYLRDWDEFGAPWEYWVERTESARAAFAKLINAAPEEIAFKLPKLPEYKTWQQLLNTADVKRTVADFESGCEAKAPPRSVLAFAGWA